MRRLELIQPTSRRGLERTPGRDGRLGGFLQTEITCALSDRKNQESEWIEARRQYAAQPRQAYRHTPVPDAPNIEVPLGAIECDALYARMMTTLWSSDPLLTARAQASDWDDTAKAAQRWVNYVAEQEVGLRMACEHAFADCIQLGTAAFYVPFVEDVVRTSIASSVYRGPKLIPIAPEDLVMLGGSRGDLQQDRWVALRFNYTPEEMRLRSDRLGWDMKSAMPSTNRNWVRRAHEAIGLTHGSTAEREEYEIYRVFCHYDYHDDGEDIDLEVIYDWNSQTVIAVDFNPYDERPIVPMRYQIRPQLAYGLGVMAMIRPFQYEATEVHNARLLNMLIANARIWIAQEGAVPDNLEVWFNRVIPARDINAIKSLEMGDVYPSALQAEQVVSALAERRVGSDNQPPIGTRTPGITAMTSVQQQNSRFTPAFDQMRMAATEAVRQGLLRQRERILAGGAVGTWLRKHIGDVLGDEADLVIDLLKQPDFDRYVQVEFTAAGPTANREADRQAAVLMFNTLITNYYRPAMEMVASAAQNPALAPVAIQIAEKVGELADRFLRTFDQTRDPRNLLLDLSEPLQKMGQGGGLQGLAQLLGGLQGEASAGQPGT